MGLPRVEPSAIVRKRTVPCLKTNWHTYCNDTGMMIGLKFDVPSETPAKTGQSMSVSGQLLFGGGQ